VKKTRHSIRILLLADSHLGFDLPIRPRVERRRRGNDFLANHRRALEPALRGEVELVVHGGDLFHKPRVPPSLVFQAFEPLLEVAEAGVPVFVVPGNHERARIPHDRFARHPNLHIFREPSTRRVRIGGADVALSGFPYQRRGVRELFPGLLRDTEWEGVDADLRLLSIHHCVEGATVGPSDYTFRNAPDVIRCRDLPGGFAAVLSGHIHRHQILRRDLRGRTLATPVYYPGSVERTAFAEAGEEKGFLILETQPGPDGGKVVREAFHRLPTRPMEVRYRTPGGGSAAAWPSGELTARTGKKRQEQNQLELPF
jgi:DNA repair exonuclease SbcCD nuclease subunit